MELQIVAGRIIIKFLNGSSGAGRLIIFLLLFIRLLPGASYSQKVDQAVPKGLILHDSLMNIINSHPDKALKLGFEILELPETELPDTIKAFTTLHIGVILQRNGFPLQALSFFIEAAELQENTGLSPRAGFLHIDIGNIYFHQGQLDEAQNKYRLAETLFREQKYWPGLYTAINNQALVAGKRGSYSEAKRLFRQALTLAEEKIDMSYLMAHSYQYLGMLYLDQGMQDSAIYYFQKVLNTEIRENYDNIYGLSQKTLGEVYLQIGDTASARHSFQAAERDFYKTQNKYYLLMLYRQMMEVYQPQKDADSLDALLKRAGHLAEEVQSIEHKIAFQEKNIEYYRANSKQVKLIEAQAGLADLLRERYNAESSAQMRRNSVENILNDYRHRLETQRLQIKNTRLFAASSIIFGLMLLLWLWLLINRYQNRKRIHRQDLALQENQLHLQAKEIELQHKRAEMHRMYKERAERELVLTTSHIQKNQTFLENIKKELDLLNRHSPEEGTKALRLIRHKIEEVLSKNRGWEDFKRQFIKIHPDFFEKLLEINGRLNPRELKICAYHKMNLETKDIATLCYLSIRTIESNRYRLKRKLNVKQECSLHEFINRL